MAYLRYLDGNGRIQTRALDVDHFLIGRAETCQLAFDSDMVSREHARIDLERGGRFRLRDLDSRNRTYVNGELITETLLMPGAVIRVGEFVVEFVDDAAAPERVELDFLTPDRTEPADSDWLRIKSPLSLTLGQIEQLAQLLGEQALTARAEDIADTALGQIVLELQAERGLIAIRGESKTSLRPIAQRGFKRAAGATLTPVSQSFLFAPVLQQVAGRYPKAAAQLNTKAGYAVTAVVAPLTSRGEVIGVVYADRVSAKKPFPSTAAPYAAAAGALVGATLTDAVLKLMRSAGREGGAWLSTVRRLQASMTIPPGEGFGFDAAIRRFPGRLQCGDFGTVISLDEQRCAVLVLDGGGHGISGIAQSAAMQLAIQTALSVSDDTLSDLAGVFNALNQHIAASAARQIVPCTLVGIDLAAGKLSYVNAGGMPPTLMIAPGRLVTLDQSSLVLGIDPDYMYQATRVDLPESFRLICFTDGLVEAASAAGQAFGDQRLNETLLGRGEFGSAEILLNAVTSAWTTHLTGAQAADDALIVVVARG